MEEVVEAREEEVVEVLEEVRAEVLEEVRVEVLGEARVEVLGEVRVEVLGEVPVEVPTVILVTTTEVHPRPVLRAIPNPIPGATWSQVSCWVSTSTTIRLPRACKQGLRVLQSFDF